MEPLSENNASDLARFEKLEEKVRKLVRIYTQLQEKYSSALSEIQRLEKENEQQKAELKDFQNRYKISKIVTSIADEQPEHTQLKNKINEYIREIDKCIAHLSE